MKLQTGNIYSFNYREYKHDPHPLVLVLYCDDKICHALNFHYLNVEYTDQLINMISMIALRYMNTHSMYSHYHNWMKKKIPGVIRHAYRTYKPQYISHTVQITNGHWGLQSFMSVVKQLKAKQLTTLQKRLTSKINQEKSTSIQNEKKDFDINLLSQNINNYVSQIDAILSKSRKEDQSKYTRLRRRKL